jgi:4-amino-4-deoxy-L-arabinose transferase-like glycosyltransferase
MNFVKRLAGRSLDWARRHRTDLAILAVLLTVAGSVSAVNMYDYPQRFEDEGTYMSQAWAVQNKQALTHYTYWYDHPPVGWIQIAAYTTVTDAYDRYESAIAAGREFMLVLHLATIGLLYALARRMKLGYVAAGIAVLAYALSPLAVEFSRYVLLDGIALPWLLAALLLAMSRRGHVMTAVFSAICLAIAVMSKETFAVFVPVVLYALYQHSDKRNRRFSIASFGVIFTLLCAFYVLYAALKNELIPGSGHVSLLGSIYWQLFGREGSGSLLEEGSAAAGLVGYWLQIDKWLLAAGTIALPLVAWFRNLRPIALAMFISLLIVLRGGYLPYPYVIAVLPLAALLVGGFIQHYVVFFIKDKCVGWLPSTQRIAAAVVAFLLVAGTTTVILPGWQPKLIAASTQDVDGPSRAAVDWLSDNVSRDKRIAVESAIWTDLQQKGFDTPEPVWLYKTETDPAVTKTLGGWQGIDYLALNGPTLDERNREQFPTVFSAKDNSTVVAEFGDNNNKVVIMRVNK